MGQLVWRLGGQNVADLQHNFGIPGSTLPWTWYYSNTEYSYSVLY